MPVPSEEEDEMSIFRSKRRDADDADEGIAGDGENEPFQGYRRQSTDKLVHDLPRHTQVELAAVEKYERAHDSRPAVLNKLRYLRGPEPIEGYDEMEADEIIESLRGGTDMQVLKDVRGYERKFRRRKDVLDPIVELQHELRDSRPAEPVPAYRSLGGAPVSRDKG
jgi:hypothetical protein